MIIKNCLQCNSEIKAWPYEAERKKFCSRSCLGTHNMKGNDYAKGHAPWNKGRPLPEWVKEKLSKARLGRFKEEDHPNWMGGKVTYQGLHAFIRNRLEKPEGCEHCLRPDRKLELANKSNRYLRDLDDWLYLCRFCHRKHDANNENAIKTRFGS